MLPSTIFDSPVLSVLFRKCAVRFFRWKKWKIEGSIPTSLTNTSFVIVAAPHTTGYDLPYALLLAFFFRLRIYWMGKKELFIFPFKKVLMWLGGIPINRSVRADRTKYYGEILKNSKERIHLVIAPSGTRKNTPVRSWGTGFYFIALYANVPIILTAISHTNKRASVIGVIFPTGNYERDILAIEKYYRPYLP